MGFAPAVKVVKFQMLDKQLVYAQMIKSWKVKIAKCVRMERFLVLIRKVAIALKIKSFHSTNILCLGKFSRNTNAKTARLEKFRMKTKLNV